MTSDDSIFNNNTSAFVPRNPPVPDRSTAPSPFRIDEGYSEPPRTPTGSEMMGDADLMAIDGGEALSGQHMAARQWLMSQPAEFRSSIARELLLSLPTPALAAIVRDTHARLHFDPVRYLPHEIVSSILEYADPTTLITAAIVSKAWKGRAAESRLWRKLFVQEGWLIDQAFLRDFESNAWRQIRSLRTLLEHVSSDNTAMDLDEKTDGVLQRFRQSQGDIRLWMKNGKLGMEKPPKVKEVRESHEESDRLSIVDQDEQMEDALHSQSAQVGSTADRKVYTPLLGPGNLLDRNSNPQTDWQYLYKQRRKLENNWNGGRYRNFRLPRHDHPEEAHTQCVYTMQFSPKYVVSGSRDQTIRIWSLETKRLVRKPLQGHRGSVLCLQFDESPDQDVIASGGSDADVIIWTFSTGKILKRLKHAHDESVLNLRFDDRYLITCSKDKTIKLWNRKALLPTHEDYPRVNSKSKDATFPDYIVNIDELVNTAALHSIQPLEPYTLLMTFIGHNAAVNAIQVHGDEIVSASGDRKIFLWNIKTGQLIRHYAGHTKGIACVQYDGKRIVSGSSDKNVCIFDSVTGGELAILHGHRDLVRTVQADFADAPYSDNLYAAQAVEHDSKMRELKIENRLGFEMPFSSGTKLPPGGGGNPWSKIVSGSYDETVMIWKKGRDGSWNIIKELRQDDAMRATSGISPSAQEWGPRVTMAAMAQQAQDDLRALRQQRQGQLAQMHDQALAFYQAHPAGAPNGQGLPPMLTDAQMTELNTARNATIALPAPHPHMPAHLNPQHPLFGYTAPPRPDSGSDMTSGGTRIAPPPHPLSYTPPAVPLAGPSTTTQAAIASPRSAGLPLATQRRPAAVSTSAAVPSSSRTQNTPRPSASTTRDAPPARTAPTDADAEQPRPRRRPQRPSTDEVDMNGASRVFKLQFNSRFIMCCSQQPVIVGWDFANGDREIEEASTFFGMPESTP